MSSKKDMERAQSLPVDSAAFAIMWNMQIGHPQFPTDIFI